MNDKYEENDIYAEIGSKINSGEILKEGAFKDYVRELKKHKTAIMDTDLISHQVENLKKYLDKMILKWIKEHNSEIVSIVSAQPESDSEATSESAASLRKAYGALVNFDLTQDMEMARVKAKVVVQEIKREIINTALEDIGAKYDKI